MTFFKDLFMIILSFIVSFTSLPVKSVSERAEDFRVTAYAVGGNFVNADRIDASHFTDVTDVILISVANFNTKGEIVTAANFDTIVSNLKNAMSGSDAKLHVNLIGPGYTTSSSDWNEQMDDQANRHELAFASGCLEDNILRFLEQYEFDGVFFDYEYPLTKEHWKKFDEFLLSLDKKLGDDYTLGCAISAWNTKQSRKAIAVLDLVEVMAYDIWDNDGTHASLDGAKSCVREMLLRGYKKEQLDLGIPFYARPVTKEAYWYGYNGYYNSLDENGFCVDPATGLTFSFNTYDMVYEKTKWSICRGLGGVMVWHYSCDVPKDNGISLFNAINDAKNDMIKDPYAIRFGGSGC